MTYEVTINRQGISALVDLQGETGNIGAWIGSALPGFPQAPNTFTRRDHLALCWIAPRRWLLRTTIEREPHLLDLVRPAAAPAEISVVQVSDTLCFFAINGVDAADIVSIACSMDHHASTFPSNGVSYTSVFGIRGLLLRSDDGFEIAVESSFADMVEDYLERCCR